MKVYKSFLIILFAFSSLTACSSFLEAMGSYYENVGYQPYGVQGYNCGHNHYHNTYNNTQAGYSIPAYLDPKIFAQNALPQINAQMEADKNRFLTQYRKNYKLQTGREPTAMEESEAYTQYLENMNAAYDSNTSYNNTGNSNKTRVDYNQRKKDFLNRVAGEFCTSCNGTGKCMACNGTKIASGYGVTYKCTVCPPSGICTVCNGTGKASWNR